MNPLYEVDSGTDRVRLRLRFPGAEYEEEYGACRRYLPDEAEIGRSELDALPTAQVSGSLADLVRKRVTYRPDVPLYVLGFSATKLGFTGHARTLAVMEQLHDQVQFPGETLIINVGTANDRIGRDFRAMAGSRIL